MRVANVVVVALGLAGTALAGWWIARWKNLPLTAPRRPTERHGDHAADAVRTLGAVVSAGIGAGIVVLGLVGRLVMRVLAATSGDLAQGRRTDAGETVGTISLGGTLGFLLFVGLGGGLVTSLGYLLIRRWLPDRAWVAGLVVGVLAVGTLGVLDPFTSDNFDFVVLSPRWLAMLLVAGTGVLFTITFTALAARLDRVAAGEGRRAWIPCAGLIVFALPTLTLYAIAYIGGRTLAAGRVDRWLRTPGPRLAGLAVVGFLVALTAALALRETVQLATL